jgi:general secretion pathway protein C
MMNLWTVKITTFLLWALAAASAAFWILQSTNASSANTDPSITKLNLPATVRANDTEAQSLTSQVAAALGAKNIVTPAGAMAAMQSRLQLQGVLAVGTKRGAALISVDGKPAKPYRVGSAIEEGLEVTAVTARSASIGANGAVAFTLELPNKN